MTRPLPLLTATTLMLAAPLLVAQQMGTSHPESLDDTITVTRQPAVIAKPSPAVEAPAPVLQQHTAAVAPAPPSYTAAKPLAPQQTIAANADADDEGSDNAGIVAEVFSPANELPQGTLLHVRLSEEISTRDTQPNVRFSAFLSAPLMKLGHVAVPAGAVLTGRITELSTGHHIGHAAGIHLVPEFITLPNGAHYKCEGQVIDLISDRRRHVTREGTITGNDPTPGTATTVGVATGTGAIAGAVLGGGVGAIVGAGIGAGVSGAVWANQATSATLHTGTEIIFSLERPMLLENSPITNE